MLSLSTRLLIAASVLIMAFLGLTGLVLDRAFQESALTAVQDRLQGHIYMLLGVATLDASNRLVLPETLPEARFSMPDSGLYAEVADSRGTVIWRSRSMLGLNIPFSHVSTPGEAHFERVTASDDTSLFALGFTVRWEIEPNSYRRYMFRVAETREGFKVQVRSFRRNLWGWFLGAALVLVAVQGIILRWGLKPLRQVAREVVEIESGYRTELSGPYPKELRRLTDNLNALIRHSHAHLERYRNALGDLAHSLKTPLAVLRNTVDSASSEDELRSTVQEQVARMGQTVEYQLQRAAASGRIALAAPVPVAPLVRKILESLAKVYADKPLQFDLQVNPSVVFYGDEGDLMEILGNLADNACKWSRRRVEIRADALEGPSGEQVELVLEVEDDGPGIPVDKMRAILNRGERADPNTAGHGIGLAVVRDLVEEVYQGTLAIDSGPLGGVRVRVSLRF